jgi:hypothetical protein
MGIGYLLRAARGHHFNGHELSRHGRAWRFTIPS